MCNPMTGFAQMRSSIIIIIYSVQICRYKHYQAEKQGYQPTGAAGNLTDVIIALDFKNDVVELRFAICLGQHDWVCCQLGSTNAKPTLTRKARSFYTTITTP